MARPITPPDVESIFGSFCSDLNVDLNVSPKLTLLVCYISFDFHCLGGISYSWWGEVLTGSWEILELCTFVLY